MRRRGRPPTGAGGPNRGDPIVVSPAVMTTPAPVAAPIEPDPEDDFDAVFRAHYERLVRALTIVSGDRESAADAVQEAFVRAHLRWRRVRHYDDPVGWVRRVAINRLRDDHRRAGRKQRALERLAGSVERHGAAADAGADHGGLDELLAALPRQQRLATALFYVEELSVAEVADVLGLADGTVKSHLHDARRRLRAVLDDAPGSP